MEKDNNETKKYYKKLLLILEQQFDFYIEEENIYGNKFSLSMSDNQNEIFFLEEFDKNSTKDLDNLIKFLNNFDFSYTVYFKNMEQLKIEYPFIEKTQSALDYKEIKNTPISLYLFDNLNNKDSQKYYIGIKEYTIETIIKNKEPKIVVRDEKNNELNLDDEMFYIDENFRELKHQIEILKELIKIRESNNITLKNILSILRKELIKNQFEIDKPYMTILINTLTTPYFFNNSYSDEFILNFIEDIEKYLKKDIIDIIKEYPIKDKYELRQILEILIIKQLNIPELDVSNIKDISYLAEFLFINLINSLEGWENLKFVSVEKAIGAFNYCGLNNNNILKIIETNNKFFHKNNTDLTDFYSGWDNNLTIEENRSLIKDSLQKNSKNLEMEVNNGQK